MKEKLGGEFRIREGEDDHTFQYVLYGTLRLRAIIRPNMVCRDRTL